MIPNSPSRARVVAATVFSVAFAASASAQAPQFRAHRDYPSGYGPVSIAVGDVDGDLRPDLAVAHANDGTIAVLLGNADGTFRQAQSVYMGPNDSPRSVAIGDFDRNGRADLAVACPGSNTVLLLSGNGDGTFQSAVRLLTSNGPSAVAVADFNGDGKSDLAIANRGSDDVSVLLGNGDGTFQSPRNVAAGSGPAFLAVGDFNRDNKPDLAVADWGSGRVAVLLSNGNGTFQTPQLFLPGNILSVWSVAVGDFTGDGAPDLVAANYAADTVAVALGNGNGTFGEWRSFQAGGGPTAIAVGDFDRDGRLDLAVAHESDGTLEGSSTVSVLSGQGDGTFGAPRTFAIGSVSWAVAPGDFNGDGAADLAVANTMSTTVSVLLGYGDGTFPAAPAIAVDHNPESIAAGDFDGDGKLDLATANQGADTVSVLLANGPGTFAPARNIDAGPGPVSLAAGDFNGDGKRDLAVSNYGANNYYTDAVASTISVLLGNGDGTFKTARTFPTGSGPKGVAVGDFNRDGAQDLAVADYGPQSQRGSAVSVLLGNGDGTFRAPQSFQAGRGPSSVAVADFNRDGLQDLAVADYEDTTVSVLLGRGDGTFQPPLTFGVGTAPKFVAVGDFNGDGNPDLAVPDHFSDTVSVLLGNGDGTFRPRLWFETGRNPAWASVADFNGDGKPDLAVANWFATTVSLLIGNGDGTFEAGPDFGAGAAPGALALGDFNNDGQPDLAAANYFSANVSVLTNTTTLPRVATPTFNPPGGTYLGPQTVTISVATSGATIHYTTDGSAPTASSAVYTGPIVIIQTTTIRAIAVASGMTDSLVGSATYTIQVLPPTFNPPAGTYVGPLTVALGTATSGATIHYTTDGSTPTTASPVYTNPVAVAGPTTIRAIAVASGRVDSTVASATYTLQAATPTFNPPGGSYLVPQFVSISDASPGVTIYYTTDGTTPTTSSSQYTGAILVLRTATIKAIAVAPGWAQSAVASSTYQMLLP